MFQLIVAIVGIALVVILAVIALWVGGIAFTSSGEKATFATYFNQGSQIEGALKMYGADIGSSPTAATSDAMLELLISKEYLRSRPKGAWEIVGTSIYLPLDDVANPGTCKRLNEFAGKNISLADAADDGFGTNVDWQGCPPCQSATGATPAQVAVIKTFSDWPGCRRVAAPVTP